MIDRHTLTLNLDQTGRSIRFVYHPRETFKPVEIELRLPHGQVQDLGSTSLQSLRLQLVGLLSVVRELEKMEGEEAYAKAFVQRLT